MEINGIADQILTEHGATEPDKADIFFFMMKQKKTQ